VPTQAAVRAQGVSRLGGKDWTVGKLHMPPLLILSRVAL
jgi:hypothetical protein